MENNKNKKSVKFQGDMLNFYDFIQVFVFTRNHHLKPDPDLLSRSGQAISLNLKSPAHALGELNVIMLCPDMM